MALLTTKKRQATVKAGANLKLLSLDRPTFKRVLGPIEDVLHRNMEVYNKIRAAVSDHSTLPCPTARAFLKLSASASPTGLLLD